MKYRYNVQNNIQKVKTKAFMAVATLGLLLGASGLSLLTFSTAHAAAGYTLYGDASYVNPGAGGSSTAVQEIWSPTQPYGGIDFSVPSGMTVSGLINLSTDYQFTAGTCSQGSPRFQINVLAQNVFVYLGSQFPSTNACAGNTYSNSGNVISPTSMVDATQLGNGYETWAAFQSQHPSDLVTGIQLVVDGYTTPYITAQFDNTEINATLYTYEPTVPATINQCKNNGWTGYTSPTFKNQGDCVSWVQHNVNGNGVPASSH